MRIFKQQTSRILLSALCLTMLTPFSVSANTLDEIKKEAEAPIEQGQEKPKFEEGKSSYSGKIETTNIANLTVTTQHGDLPIVLLCKANAKDWGLMAVYLDQITDENIRYRRVSGQKGRGNRLPAVIFSTKGEFIKTDGVFPPSDCNEKNILK